MRAKNDLEFATALMNSTLKENAATTVESHQTDADNPDHDNPNIEGQAQAAHQSDAVTCEESGLYVGPCRWCSSSLKSMWRERTNSPTGSFPKKNWEDIAEAMKCRSPLITGPHCASKIRSLKKTFKSVKDHNNKSDKDRRTWQFYEKMDNIFQSKVWASTVAVAYSSGVSSQRNQESENEGPSDLFSSRKPKENVASLLKNRLIQKSKEEEARAKRHKERMEMDENTLALLSNLVDK